MKQIIKLSTDGTLTVHDFPAGTRSQQNEELEALIGETCEIYERVRPFRLYSVMGMTPEVTGIPGQAVSMLVDEEGLLKNLAVNPMASWLYGTDHHGNAIVGNVLFVGEQYACDGIDFCGIDEKVLPMLQQALKFLRGGRR